MSGNDSLGRPPQQAIFEFSRKGKSQKWAGVYTPALLAV